MSNQMRIWGAGSYFSQIWRSSQSDSVPFYPLWYNQFLNRKLPVIIDTNNLMLVYVSVPLLRTVIDKKAELLMNGRLKVVKIDYDEQKDGKNYDEFPDDPILQLLHNPNALEHKGEFIQQWSIMRDIYATALIYKKKISANGFPKALWVLPTGEMKINPTGFIFEQMDVEGIISNYEHINNLFPHASPKFYKPNEIMRYIDGPSDRYYFGISKIVTNKLLISNLQQSLTTRNVLMSDMGARGILSNNQPDVKPLGDGERKEIGKAHRRDYGNGDDQERIIITNNDLKWQSICYPTKDLMAFEEVESCFCGICDVYGLQRSLFADTTVSKAKDSIGADGAGKIQEALKISYETVIQNTANEFCRVFNHDEDYGLAARGRKLIMRFDHLPVMQEDQVSAEAIQSQKKAGASTQTASLLALNAAVTSGQMELDAALSIAINIHGIEESIASQIILKPKKIQSLQPSAEMNDEQKRFIEIMLNPTNIASE